LILHGAGRTPEMFDDIRVGQDTLAKINSKLDVLDSLEGFDERLSQRLEALVLDTLKHLKKSDPEGLRKFANSASNDEETATLGGMNVSDTFAENTRKAAKMTFKQRQQQKGDQ
jgi:hypothetical protein